MLFKMSFLVRLLTFFHNVCEKKKRLFNFFFAICFDSFFSSFSTGTKAGKKEKARPKSEIYARKNSAPSIKAAESLMTLASVGSNLTGYLVRFSG